MKVSMDGAPYLRKVDLKTCKNYVELSKALEKMFNSVTLGMNLLSIVLFLYSMLNFFLKDYQGLNGCIFVSYLSLF